MRSNRWPPEEDLKLIVLRHGVCRVEGSLACLVADHPRRSANGCDACGTSFENRRTLASSPEGEI